MKILHFLRFLNDTLCIGIDGTSDADLEAALGRDLYRGPIELGWQIPYRNGGFHRKQLELPSGNLT